jgi:hypothetical protein
MAYFGWHGWVISARWFVPYSLGECAPEMSKEERDFPESSAANRPYEASAVEVEFGRTVTRMFYYFI